MKEQVVGIAAISVRAVDPEALMSWYAEQLGVTGVGHELAGGPAGPGAAIQPFPHDTDYFGRPEQSWMLNFRVRDLDAMLSQLRAAGAEVEERIEDSDFGRFGWASDPEGNRFELWQPRGADGG